ncbi:SMI1/KNR4 family protein [Hahella sp. HN01]|uniref:SMI1/KNR4 family protein n=1 Tax=Hahella sp. HN01 TaxID=2847262 RepID=UPI001C1EB6C3|nr:SMI1/KNR4 family protein [Hahella sp. HN01]MBU6952736.1 SMI1/KNR4 family protein [Hahella sp. HN01]
MNIIDANKYGFVDKLSLDKFRLAIPGNLPQDFYKYLMSYNGGIPENRRFSIPGEGEDYIHIGYGIHNGPDSSRLDKKYNLFKHDIGEIYLPVFADPFGNQLVIDLSESGGGAVLFWDHESSGGYGKLKRLSPNFSSFLGSLSPGSGIAENELSSCIDNDDVSLLSKLLGAGLRIDDSDEYGRNLMERAAIAGAKSIIIFLNEKNVPIKSSIELARRNAEFFDEHKEVVVLLEDIERKKNR